MNFADQLRAAVRDSVAQGEMTDALGSLCWQGACRVARTRGLVDDDDVDDAASFAITRLMSRWQKLSGTPNPHNMLATVLHRAICDWQRSRGRHARMIYVPALAEESLLART